MKIIELSIVNEATNPPDSQVCCHLELVTEEIFTLRLSAFATCTLRCRILKDSGYSGKEYVKRKHCSISKCMTGGTGEN